MRANSNSNKNRLLRFSQVPRASASHALACLILQTTLGRESVLVTPLDGGRHGVPPQSHHPVTQKWESRTQKLHLPAS